MAITPSNKIKVTRIKGMPALVNNTGKYIINENNEIKYVDETYFGSFLNSTDIVKGFKIESMDGYNLTHSSCQLISPRVNGKQYILNLEGGTVDTSKSFGEGGSADEIINRTWIQPTLTSSSSSPLLHVGTTKGTHAGYYPWRVFGGGYWESESSKGDLIITTSVPLLMDKLAFNNGNVQTFTFHGVNDNGEQDLLLEVDGFTKKAIASSWNEWDIEATKAYKKYIFNCVSTFSGRTLINEMELIGNYSDYRLPQEFYNVFVIGKESIENPEPRIITTIHDFPILPEGYTYAVKVGFYKTNLNSETEFFYPKMDLIDTYNDSFVLDKNIAEDGSNGYIVYTNGWKIQWGNNANPTFPIAFDKIPVIVSRGATSVSRTKMTITAQKWVAEGY